MARILIIDDESDLVWAIRYSLRADGHEVLTAANGLAGLATMRASRPDLVVLDVAMPELDGIQVCWQLRRDPALAALPVIFLSHRSAVEDRVSALEEGGDDYLAKPFDLRELKARVRALLRRDRGAERAASGDWLSVGPLTLDLNACQIRLGEHRAQLTPAEFALLRYLMDAPGKVFSSQHLVERVLGYPPETADSSLVRWHIKKLRAKLEPHADSPVLLRTIPRHGYLLSIDELPNPSRKPHASAAYAGLH
jgi:DNA-binding response OmpR family regulator